jgi:hypothetical protein
MKARAVVTSFPEFLHYRKKPVKAIQETTESHTRRIVAKDILLGSRSQPDVTTERIVQDSEAGL